jgi:2-polyprenyl-3-methyl-5-hydroxy-6-metoxy-1,4-benzoquinol methylase
MDKSNGYEDNASLFIKFRGQIIDGIGTSSVRKWVRKLTPKAIVLDLGCGTGIPITKILIDEGMNVYGIDASHTLVEAFKNNFPNTSVACESVEESLFFNRKFDGIIAWGLLFLLPKEAQAVVIQKAATALQTGGKFLFTAPFRKTIWKDAMTGHYSRSLGAENYKKLISTTGLTLIEELKMKAKIIISTP